MPAVNHPDIDEFLDGGPYSLAAELGRWIVGEHRGVNVAPWTFWVRFAPMGMGEEEVFRHVFATDEEFVVDAIPLILDQVREGIYRKGSTAPVGRVRVKGFARGESSTAHKPTVPGLTMAATLQPKLQSSVKFQADEFGHMERVQYHQTILGMAGELRAVAQHQAVAIAALSQSLNEVSAVRTPGTVAADIGSSGMGGLGGLLGMVAFAAALPVVAPMLGIDGRKNQMGVPLLLKGLQARVANMAQGALSEAAVTDATTKALLSLAPDEQPIRPAWFTTEAHFNHPVPARLDNAETDVQASFVDAAGNATRAALDEQTIVRWLQEDPDRLVPLLKTAGENDDIIKAFRANMMELSSLIL